jgi:hypothetical protein
VLSSLPRRNNCPLAKCGCKKHCRVGLSRRPHSHLYSSLRCNQGARLDGILPWPSVSHGWTHGSHTTRGHGQRRPTARRRGDSQIPTRPSGQPEPGRSPMTVMEKQPPLVHPPACTANCWVFFFYRPTGRPRRTSPPLECHRNKTSRTRSVSSVRKSTSR